MVCFNRSVWCVSTCLDGVFQPVWVVCFNLFTWCVSTSINGVFQPVGMVCFNQLGWCVSTSWDGVVLTSWDGVFQLCSIGIMSIKVQLLINSVHKWDVRSL